MEKHGESQCSGTAAPAGEEKAATDILDEEFLMWSKPNLFKFCARKKSHKKSHNMFKT